MLWLIIYIQAPEGGLQLTTVCQLTTSTTQDVRFTPVIPADVANWPMVADFPAWELLR